MKARLKTLSSLELVLEVWDHYSAGRYDLIVSNPDYQSCPSVDLRDLRTLATLELGQEPMDAQGELFNILVDGMKAYFAGEKNTACDLLGRWLLEHDYFTETILTRFVACASETKHHARAYQVLKKYYPVPAYKTRLVEPLMNSAYEAGMHREVITIFEEHRNAITDLVLVQKTAMSMIQLGLYTASEKLLLHYYEKATGKSYDMGTESKFQEIRASYAKRVKEIEKKKNGTNEDVMELGLAYLFSERYNDALRMFQSIKNARAA